MCRYRPCDGLMAPSMGSHQMSKTFIGSEVISNRNTSEGIRKNERTRSYSLFHHSHTSSAEVKNAWRYTSTPNVFMACKRRDNLLYHTTYVNSVFSSFTHVPVLHNN
jgi:hypothetical protein